MRARRALGGVFAAGVLVGGCRGCETTSEPDTSGLTIPDIPGTGGSSGESGWGGWGGQPECHVDGECSQNPNGPLCDPEKGKCVSCIPDPDPALDCGIGLWCAPFGQFCEAGCTGDADCDFGLPLFCDIELHACVECLSDEHCPAGKVCHFDSCVSGCDADSPCPSGYTCCNKKCVDLANNPKSCGECGHVCEPIDHAVVTCEGGQCALGGCNQGWADCNGQVADGCEHLALSKGDCSCEPGAVEDCYFGASGTAGVGPCTVGKRVCAESGIEWSACTGQVMPIWEICANGVDDDCDGTLDEVDDQDGDGWGYCEGDCDDFNWTVNPGAVEVVDIWVDDDGNLATPPVLVEGVGNGLDDDCNPATPDFGAAPPCDTGPLSAGVTALDLAHAMELCTLADENAPKAQRTWGILSAELRRPDGSVPDPAELADFQNLQTAVLGNYGVIGAKVGSTFAGLSTGKMRDEDDAEFAPALPGTDFGRSGAVPAVFLAAQGGVLPSYWGCNGTCPSGSGARDGVALRLRIRVPSNMNVFSFKHRFLTGEYPSNMCTDHNDGVLALYDSKAKGIPADKNVVFDSWGNHLFVSNTWFDLCSPVDCYICPQGALGLAGTGMPAGTIWLQADIPAVLGEDIMLELMVFDVSSGEGDSVLLLDGFKWSYDDPYNLSPHG